MDIAAAKDTNAKPASPLAEAADAAIDIKAGPEKSVAATKTFVNSALAGLAISAVAMAGFVAAQRSGLFQFLQPVSGLLLASLLLGDIDLHVAVFAAGSTVFAAGSAVLAAGLADLAMGQGTIDPPRGWCKPARQTTARARASRGHRPIRMWLHGPHSRPRTSPVSWLWSTARRRALPVARWQMAHTPPCAAYRRS